MRTISGNPRTAARNFGESPGVNKRALNRNRVKRGLTVCGSQVNVKKKMYQISVCLFLRKPSGEDLLGSVRGGGVIIVQHVLKDYGLTL